jgi:hypothetical protein
MIAYSGPFLALASIPVLYSVFGRAGPFGTIALLLLALIGAEAISLRGAPPAPKQSPRLFRLLPFAYVPLQLVAIVWAMNEAARPQMPPVGFLALHFFHRHHDRCVRNADRARTGAFEETR